MKRQLPKPNFNSDPLISNKVKPDLVEPLLKAKPFLPAWFIPGFNDFWPYRNYVHALNELKKGTDKPITPSVAYLGLALLNSYLTEFSSRRFIDKVEWEVIAGHPEYHKRTRALLLPIHKRPAHSFLLLKDPPGRDFTLGFKAHIPENGLLNFVFNFKSPRQFKMVRIDKRPGLHGIHEGLLICDDWFHWTPIAPHGFSPVLDPNIFEHKVTIQASHGNLSIEIDGQGRTQPGRSSWQFDPGLRIGLFNEEVRVLLYDFQMSQK